MTAWLLTWLWQGLALAAVVRTALRFAPGLNAATRHLIWCGALAALSWLGWASAPYRGQPPVQVPGSDPIYIPSAPDFFISILFGVWMALALVNLLRLLPGLHAVYALRDRCRPFPPDIESRLPLWLEARARGRRTELAICDEVPGATVLGLQRPCIALPPSLVDALTLDELDQVIIHEHAHVQRFDDWSRLAQTLLLSVLWIHPAAVLISRALNREREMACDEWVVARTGMPKAYARCLAHAAEVQGRTRAGSALVPALVGRRHELVRRVDRILAFNGHRHRKVSRIAAAAAALAMAAASVQLQGFRFAEIADVVLPHVARPVIAVYNGATIAFAEAPAPAELKAHTALVARATVAAPVAPVAPDMTHASSAGSAEPTEPVAPIAASVTFAGVYSVPHAPVEATSNRPNRWSALGTPGVEVASAAKKTSIGVANLFSRAGASLARSF